MATFLDSERSFSKAASALLAGQVVNDFDGVFRKVVRGRLEWASREGHTLFPRRTAPWSAIA